MGDPQERPRDEDDRSGADTAGVRMAVRRRPDALDMAEVPAIHVDTSKMRASLEKACSQQEIPWAWGPPLPRLLPSVLHETKLD